MSNYKLLDSYIDFQGRVTIGYRTFSFTLPSSKKTCVAKGKWFLAGDLMEISGIDFVLSVGKKQIGAINWVSPKVPLDTSKLKEIDRTQGYTKGITKCLKKWKKSDITMTIKAFDTDWQEIYDRFWKAKEEVFGKEKTKSDFIETLLKL